MIKTIERLYKDRFSTFEYGEKTDEITHQTTFEDACVLMDIPCRCSYSSDSVAVEDDGAYKKTQTVKIITSVGYDIKPGTKIVVTKATGQTVVYKASGQTAYYPSHQEINVELWEEYT